VYVAVESCRIKIAQDVPMTSAQVGYNCSIIQFSMLTELAHIKINLLDVNADERPILKNKVGTRWG